MKRKWFWATCIAVGLLLIGGIYGLPALTRGAAAQARASTPTPIAATPAPIVDINRTITVVGEGTVSAEPDQAEVMVGVETRGDTVQEATGESADIMEALLEALEAEDVAIEDIRTSGYSVWTEYVNRPEGTAEEQEAIYHVNNIVTVKVRDLDNLGAILDGAIEAGANSIQGITFTIEDKAELAADARAQAAADARAKAEELAGLMNVEVGPVVSVSEVIGASVYPVLRQAAMGLGGGGAGPISAGKLDYTTQLQVVYAIQ